jgi:hypothetical protein
MTHRRISWILLGLLVLVLTSAACNWPTPTSTAPPAAGLVIQGHVWLSIEEGVGLAEVKIYRRYASYSGVLVATTDQDGYYKSDFASIPGDEMVTIWAELEGYAFEPEQYYWRHYYGYESRTLNFVAAPIQPAQ